MGDQKDGCWNCKHMKSAVTWWCSSEIAIKENGTSIPQCVVWCKQWEPVTEKPRLLDRIKGFYWRVL